MTQSQRIDVLVVAHSLFTAINRRPYNRLRQQFGWAIEMSIPERLPSIERTVDVQGVEDCPIHWVRAVGSNNNRYWTFDGLRTVLRERRPRAIILESEPDSRLALELGRWSARNGGRLILVSNENDVPPVIEAVLGGNVKSALRSLRARLVSWITKKNIDHVIAICHDGAEAMTSLGFAGRISQMPLGFEPSVFFPDLAARALARREYNLQDTVIAYVGRLVPIKGVHVLLEALERLGDLPWHFLIDDFFADPGAYSRRIRTTIETSSILTERTVRFTADHEQVARFMNAADVVVVPSIWKEQYGRVAPEAMACGCAVVVSRAGALPELVGDTGVVVPQNDPTALARVLRELIVSPDRRAALGRAASQRALAHLSINEQAACLDRCLRGLITRPI
jgi:glycosyltransferase involved in cell wall biosynthesis